MLYWLFLKIIFLLPFISLFIIVEWLHTFLLIGRFVFDTFMYVREALFPYHGKLVLVGDNCFTSLEANRELL